MRDVGAMTQENDRNKANVRIYCDDEEKRWKERVDPNTGRKLGGWEDTDNWLVYRYNMRPGCLLTTLGKGKTTFGETFKEHLEGDPPVPQPDLRATISVNLLLHVTYLHIEANSKIDVRSCLLHQREA